MAPDFHGRNGLDPETSVHLPQTYVLPIQVYGLEGGSSHTLFSQYLEARQRPERQTRRLCQSLHVERCKRLAIIREANHVLHIR